MIGVVKGFAVVVVLTAFMTVLNPTAWFMERIMGFPDATSRLSDAATNGDLPGVRRALRAGAQMERVDAAEASALSYAVCRQRYAIVESLLAAGARVDGSPLESATPLACAAAIGDPAVAELLLRHGADPKACRSPDLSPLVAAARRGSLPIVRLLLAHDKSPNRRQLDLALIEAAGASDDPALLQLLLEAGASGHAVNSFGRNALEIALQQQHAGNVAYLTRAGATFPGPAGVRREARRS